MTNTTQWQFGELLVNSGLISDEQLASALSEQEKSDLPLGEILRLRGAITQQDQCAMLRLQQRLRSLPPPIAAYAREHGDDSGLRAAARLRLGDVLLEEGEITADDLQLALREQRSTGRRLGDVLTHLGVLSRTRLGIGLSLQKKLLSAAFGAALAMGAGPALAAAPAKAKPVKLAAAHPSSARPYQDASRLAHQQFPELRTARSAQLQDALDKTLADMGLGGAVANKQLAVALVDVTDLHRPHLAAVNGDHMMYAASLPKIGILLGAMAAAKDGMLDLDEQTRAQLTRMIRRSSNRAATAMYYAVGPEHLAETLEDYGLYDPDHNGGLWVGKPYGKAAAWKRDPLHGLSHGASPIQVARFLYLMETGQLVSPEMSAEMKTMMSNPAINHKFVKGLNANRPGSTIYRKSGTWRTWHSDCAVVERDGRKYIAVALANSSEGSNWLSSLIVKLDDIVFQYGEEPVQVAEAR